MKKLYNFFNHCRLLFSIKVFVPVEPEIELGYKYCCYCEHPLTNKNRTIDHLIPLCKKGNNSTFNKAFCCKKCNKEKGHRLLQTWLKYLPNIIENKIKRTNIIKWITYTNKNINNITSEIMVKRSRGVTTKIRAKRAEKSIRKEIIKKYK